MHGCSVFLVFLTAVGCASWPVTEAEVTPSETLLAIQESAITGESLSLHTEQVLRILDLEVLWNTDPAAVPAAISEVEGGQPEWIKRVAAAEIYYELADRAEEPAAAQLYLQAVMTALEPLREENPRTSVLDPRRRLIAEIYNRALGRFLALGQELHGHPKDWLSVSGVDRDHPFRIAEGERYWDVRAFDSFIPAEERRYSGRLPNRHRDFGLGATLIAVQREAAEPGSYLLPTLRSMPATAMLMHLDDGSLELELFNPYATDTVTMPTGEVPLNMDFSSPLGHLVANGESPSGTENQSFFDPEALEARQGIYMTQPYDPQRIPVLLVHGLWSSPSTWIEVVNEIWGDRELRDRYQIWLYLYPTGYALPLNAAALRRQLLQMRRDLDPEDDDPAMQDMVVIGHSMGGILSKTLVSSSGDDFWNAVSVNPIDEVEGTEGDLAFVRNALFFEPLPFVTRVVFIATPHRGAPTADNLEGTLGDWLITLPEEAGSEAGRIIRDNPGVFPGYESGLHTSIDDLSESSPALLALTSLPIAEGLPYHSIMGDVTGEATPDTDDGVVHYRSSHLEGARSEIIVSHDHSAHRDPAAQLEIRRILREHLTLGR